MVDTVVNHADIPFGDAKELFDIRSGILTHSNDFVLAAGEEFHHDATVEHSREIILIAYTEGGEVVNRGDKRTRPRPNQLAIVWDMQKIEL